MACDEQGRGYGFLAWLSLPCQIALGIALAHVADKILKAIGL